MDKRVNSSSAVSMYKQQVMKKLKAVDIMSNCRTSHSSSFIDAVISN